MLERIQDLLDHPFWNDVIALKQPTAKDTIVKLVSTFPQSKKQAFLQEVIDGFYVLTAVAPHVFKRIDSLLKVNGSGNKLARMIFETELGLHPLIKGTQYDGVTHAEQFRLLIESLEEGIVLVAPQNAANRFRKAINIENASLETAIAYAVVIENNGADIIFFLEEFVAQWQVYNGRRSKDVKYNFLLEHGLLEGSESSDQHVVMVDKLSSDLREQIDISKLQSNIDSLIRLYHNHLDVVYKKIIKLVQE